jgi:hypothetical protein
MAYFDAMDRYLVIFLLAVFAWKPYTKSLHTFRSFPHVIRLDATAAVDSLTCVLPFTRMGNLILIRATADAQEGYFVLDTGTPDLALNVTYFRHYPTNNPTESGGVTGSVTAASQTAVDSLVLGQVRYFHVEANLLNLGHIENDKGVKIFGLLGMKLFAQFEMIIDYDQGLLYLHRIGKKEVDTYRSDLLKDTLAYTVVPIHVEENKIILYGVLKGRKLKFVVDSGAETSILDSRLPNKVFESVVITRTVRLNGSGTQKVEALYGSLRNLYLGDRRVDTLPVLITNLQSMCDAYNNCIDGMLCVQSLSEHKIGFNFVTDKMYLWK